MKNSFYIDLQGFMLIPTKFPLSHNKCYILDLFLSYHTLFSLLVVYLQIETTGIGWSL